MAVVPDKATKVPEPYIASGPDEDYCKLYGDSAAKPKVKGKKSEGSWSGSLDDISYPLVLLPHLFSLQSN